MIVKKNVKYIASSILLLSIILLVLFVFISPATSDVKSKDELLAVSVIFRHGDRAPFNFYRNDPHRNSNKWLVGPGELTKIGKLQHYNFGKWLRSRYDNFLTPLFNESEVYVRSSDDNRCLMSAASNLAGLFQPNGDDIWNDELPWQPIPIHTMPKNQDDVIESQSSCPKMIGLIDKAKKLDKFKKIVEENKDLFKYVEENSGEQINYDIVELGYITDTLYIEQLYNLTLPDWAEKVYKRMEKLHLASFELLTSTEELTKFSIGRFFDFVSTQFHYFSGDVKNAATAGPKWRMFSGHDDQVFCTLKALKVDVEEIVPYAASVTFELLKKEDGSLYVQVLFKKPGSEAEFLKIEDCDGPCSYENFMNVIKDIAITKENFKEKCIKST